MWALAGVLDRERRSGLEVGEEEGKGDHVESEDVSEVAASQTREISLPTMVQENDLAMWHLHDSDVAFFPVFCFFCRVSLVVSIV